MCCYLPVSLRFHAMSLWWRSINHRMSISVPQDLKTTKHEYLIRHVARKTRSYTGVPLLSYTRTAECLRVFVSCALACSRVFVCVGLYVQLRHVLWALWVTGCQPLA